MSDHITRYSVMPIPPIEAHTRYFQAGALRVGVEYRRLSDAVAAAAQLEAAAGSVRGQTTDLADRGVSIHVFGSQDGEEREFLRFDCFEEDPHYHYISWRNHTNEMLHMDPVAMGDPVAFALECIEERLPALLTRAGAEELAAEVQSEAESAALALVLPELRAEAMRLRRADGAELPGDSP